MAGKGDTRRPSRVSRQELERRWEQAFGKGHGIDRCGDPECGCMEPWPPPTPENMVAAQREKNRLLRKALP